MFGCLKGTLLQDFPSAYFLIKYVNLIQNLKPFPISFHKRHVISIIINYIMSHLSFG
jgi:hypothetical protein